MHVILIGKNPAVCFASRDESSENDQMRGMVCMADESAKYPQDLTFAWVLNALEVDCELPIEILPGYLLTRASDAQLERIKAFTKSIGLESRLMPHEFRANDSGSGTLAELPRQEWKYFVIERCAGNVSEIENMGYLNIENASRLTDLELRCNVYFMARGHSHMFQMGLDPFAELSLMPLHRKASRLTKDLVQEFHRLDQLIRNIGQEYRDVTRALTMFRQVCAMPELNELTFLGMFAIIESLLTHAPHDQYDSLTHQIKTKVPLLDRRMQRHVDYGEFGGANCDTLWSKLYAYRSCIAHGGALDFDRTFKVLRNRETVAFFLRSATKAILCQTLVEPQLVLDLRRC